MPISISSQTNKIRIGLICSVFLILCDHHAIMQAQRNTWNLLKIIFCRSTRLVREVSVWNYKLVSREAVKCQPQEISHVSDRAPSLSPYEGFAASHCSGSSTRPLVVDRLVPRSTGCLKNCAGNFRRCALPGLPAAQPNSQDTGIQSDTVNSGLQLFLTLFSCHAHHFI